MYFILELQTNDGVGAILPARTAETKNEALSIFYSVSASAAISSVQVHTVMLVDEMGQYLDRICFKH